MNLRDQAPASARTVPVQGDMVRKLPDARKAGRRKPLPTRPDAPQKTIQDAEQGKEKYLSTVSMIAKALGVDAGKLIEGEMPASLDLSARPDRVDVDIELDRVFEEFDETVDVPALLAAVKKVIRVNGITYIVVIAQGSVRLTVNMDRDDARRLQAAFRAGKLRMHDVTLVHIHPKENAQPTSDPPLTRRPFRPRGTTRTGFPAISAGDWSATPSLPACSCCWACT